MALTNNRISKTNRIQLNPELEELRKSVQPAPSIDETLDTIVQKTKDIHAAFLFCSIGERLLQEIARCLCATRTSLYYSGWKELGLELGLDLVLQETLENCRINDQDPVFNMLSVYIQKEGAMVSNIYKALHAIKRPDIIVRTQSLLEQFCEKYNNNYEFISEKLIMKIPEALQLPHILKDLDNCKIDDTIHNINKKKIDDMKCQSAPVTVNNNAGKQRRYDKVIMLTHSVMDANVARDIAAQMRNAPKHKVKIGVILLDEHANKVHADPETFISNCYAQADYILPIMTVDYLNEICSPIHAGSALGNIDGAYMKYVYSLMTYEYNKNHCRNYKIRCLIPDKQFHDVQDHSLAGNPEFRVWIKISEILNFIDKIE